MVGVAPLVAVSREGGAITALVAGDRKLDDVRRIVGLKSEKRRRRVCGACVEGRVESSSQRDLAMGVRVRDSEQSVSHIVDA